MNRHLFKAIRLEKGLTQREFGELLGLSQSTIANIEAGRREITDTVRARLAKNVNMTDDFFSFYLRFQEFEYTIPV